MSRERIKDMYRAEAFKNMEKQNRIAELEAEVERLKAAIIDANGWLEAGEGVDLLYYFACNEDQESRALIESILKADKGE